MKKILFTLALLISFNSFGQINLLPMPENTYEYDKNGKCNFIDTHPLQHQEQEEYTTRQYSINNNDGVLYFNSDDFAILKENIDNDLKIIRYLHGRQNTNQREMSESLNISLGKVNYILKALMEKGIIKARNFKNNKNKRAYMYFLTAKGIEEKARLTLSFFDRKSQEYDKLRQELIDLEKEMSLSENKRKDYE